MNCYQKILQKNVYRTSAGNCDEIASVVSLHRNDKGLVTRTERQVCLQWQETCGRFPKKNKPLALFIAITTPSDKS